MLRLTSARHSPKALKAPSLDSNNALRAAITVGDDDDDPAVVAVANDDDDADEVLWCGLRPPCWTVDETVSVIVESMDIGMGPPPSAVSSSCCCCCSCS